MSHNGENIEPRRSPMACRPCRASKQKCSRAAGVVTLSGAPVCDRCAQKGKAEECIYLPVAVENNMEYAFMTSTAEDYARMPKGTHSTFSSAFHNTTLDVNGLPVAWPIQGATPPTPVAFVAPTSNPSLSTTQNYPPGQYQAQRTTYFTPVPGNAVAAVFQDHGYSPPGYSQVANQPSQDPYNQHVPLQGYPNHYIMAPQAQGSPPDWENPGATGMHLNYDYFDNVINNEDGSYSTSRHT